MSGDKVLTLNEAAARLKVGYFSLHWLIRKGGYTPQRSGPRYAIPAGDLPAIGELLRAARKIRGRPKRAAEAAATN